MRRIIRNLIPAFLCFSAVAFAQDPVLKPFIGLSKLPADGDPVCPIPVYTGDFDHSGYAVGDTVPDFTLYDIGGKGMHLQDELSSGKPVLLIAGSYTCPVYRNRMPEINDVYKAFSKDVSIFIVYVVEAHPQTDPSPYSGVEWVTDQNQREGVLYRQPTTYAERKAIVNEMTGAMTILPPILLDGPCNEWWRHFGPAPNNAYLIRPNGTVFSKHGWFNRAPADMMNDIDQLLGNGSGETGSGSGRFTFVLENSASVTGTAGSILAIHAKLTNPTDKMVHVKAQRQQLRLPAGWETAMCVDVCLAPGVDTVSFFVRPDTSQDFTFYFYTTSPPGDTALARVRFTNLDSTENTVTQNLRGITTAATSVTPVPAENRLRIFPNPARSGGEITLESESPIRSFALYDACGRSIYRTNTSLITPLVLPAPLVPGTYFYFLRLQSGRVRRGSFTVQ